MTRNIPGNASGNAHEPAPPRATDGLGAGVLGLVLLLAAYYHGAYALRYWGPVAILALVMLAAGVLTGAARCRDRTIMWALAGIWAFAGWSLLSTSWAESPGLALEGAGRAVLYAALFSVAACMSGSRRGAARVGAAVVAGIGVIAVITLVRLQSDGSDLFLAGRLDDPVGYRNATACLFALPFWPLVSAAARHEVNAFLRAAAFGVAVLVLGLGFLTQARGVVLGVALGAIVALALGPDRLRRAWVGLAAVAAIAVTSEVLLTPYHAFTDVGEPTPDDITTAVNALTLTVVCAAAAGLAGALLDGGLRLQDSARVTVRRVAAGALVLVAIGGVTAIVAVTGNPSSFVEQRVSEFKRIETAAPGETRLTFGGGQRSDLWRVALNEFGDNPLRGMGEGNYRFDYYRERRTDRNLSTPHSFVFEVLSQNGLVGLVALLAFVIASSLGLVVMGRRAPAAAMWWGSALAAGAAVGFGQATVDWLSLIPGVTGVAIIMLGLALASVAADPPGRRTGLIPRALAAVALTLVALLVASVYSSDVYVRKARSEPAGDVRARLDAARTAQRLNPWSVSAHYLEASAREDAGQIAQARTELKQALEAEPRNFVTLGLLGDIEVRQGRLARARAYYRRASRLNPKDVGLRKLARRGLGSHNSPPAHVR